MFPLVYGIPIACPGPCPEAVGLSKTMAAGEKIRFTTL